MQSFMFEKTGFSLGLAKCPWKLKKTNPPALFSPSLSVSVNNPILCENSCTWPVLDCHLCLFLTNPRLTLFLLLTTVVQFYPSLEGINSTQKSRLDICSALPAAHSCGSWDFHPCCPTATDTYAGEMLDVYMKSLLKERDWSGTDHAVSEAFVNKCLILVARHTSQAAQCSFQKRFLKSSL